MLELRLKRVKCVSYKYFRDIASVPEKHRHFENITQDKHKEFYFFFRQIAFLSTFQICQAFPTLLNEEE